jgi:flagellar biosynthesis protein FliP
MHYLFETSTEIRARFGRGSSAIALGWALLIGLLWLVLVDETKAHEQSWGNAWPIASLSESTDQGTDSRWVTDRPAEPSAVAEPSSGFPAPSDSSTLFLAPEGWIGPERVQSTLQVVLLMSVVSLAPAILLMTTSFIRIAVVLGLLRQAFGAQQLPPNQVITSLAMFMTLLLMTPVWTEVYRDAVRPYTDPEVAMSFEDAWQAGVQPVRRFMSRQIEIAGNSDDVWLFYQYLPDPQPSQPETYDDVPLQVLLPAFVLSELKIAFLIGFQIYLPFLVLDIVVSSITVSMGMVMLPPTMVSMPLKLMLFVLVDGWNLVVGMLMQSFAPYT